MRRHAARLSILWLASSLAFASAAEPAGPSLERRFDEIVHPFLKDHCLACHGAKKQEAKLDLSTYSSVAAVAKDYRVWELVEERLEAEEMPPEKAPRQPMPGRREAVVAWIRALREREALRNAGDPGPVLARRLSNAEFDNTIRDLTGVDIRPTREFPVDPANEAGFDNSGESLTMSPALVKKYLAAARSVADHLVLKPDGLVFAPHPAVTDTDRDKYCVRRIVDFYQQHRVDYADYFLAAWRFRHRDALGKPDAPLADFAREAGLSDRYLALIWPLLTEPAEEPGPLAGPLAIWKTLPDDVRQEARARRDCERMRDLVVRARKEIEPRIARLLVEGISNGSQPVVLWRNRQLAAQRRDDPGSGIAIDARRFQHKINRGGPDLVLSFTVAAEGDRDFVIWRSSHFRRTNKTKSPDPRRDLRTLLEEHAPAEATRLAFGRHPFGHAIDANSFVLKAPATVSVTIPAKALFVRDGDAWEFVTEGAIDRDHFGGGAASLGCTVRDEANPAGEAPTSLPYVFRADDPAVPRFQASLARFCRVFPDAFFVSQRGPYFDPTLEGPGRLLTAGFHLMQGYFRDDTPLCELILDDKDRATLDALWRELNFVTRAPIRQYRDFIFFERAESPRFLGEAKFDFARSEDKSSTSEPMMKRLAEAYLAKARAVGANDQVLDAIRTYFADISAEVRWVEKARRDAEPGHLDALKRFAERAYRRPLSQSEGEELVTFYRALREEDQLGHEDAIRDCVASVLLSPHFCYRFDRAEAGEAARPVSDHALASRLSYFLWSSMPDASLLAHAEAGDLHEPAVLVAEARRMLRDTKIRGLATEFAGNWLEFRRFEEHNGVDRARFPSFTNELRQAMYEEPIRFFIDVASHDRPVLDLLDADHTFVNPVLARHYGVPVPDGGPDAWVRVDDARRYGRGGLPAMAVFLTQNAPGLRTSPVKRGYWVVRRLLGEQIPAPPPDVPELPKDEALGDLTLPQLLARHREHKSCAGCHQRFDAIGLVFEGYGPVGERRERDLGGRPVDDRATFPDGSEGKGIDGLRRYLAERRREEFVETFCRKLLGYALGRSLVLSDATTVREMRARLSAGGNRFGELVETIVTSPQFLKKRGADDPRDR